MKLGAVIRSSSRLAVAAGGVGMYYQYGLWKSADETIENYETLKRDCNGFINSVPVVRDVVGDVGNYAASIISPLTKPASEFRKNWLSWDMSWLHNKDGILKPSWNSVVGVVSDFLAHSPQTAKDFTKSTYEKGWEYMNSGPTTRTPPSPSNAVPLPQASEAEGIKQ